MLDRDQRAGDHHRLQERRSSWATTAAASRRSTPRSPRSSTRSTRRRASTSTSATRSTRRRRATSTSGCVANGYPRSSHAGIPDTSTMLYLGGDKGWVRKELIADGGRRSGAAARRARPGPRHARSERAAAQEQRHQRRRAPLDRRARQAGVRHQGRLRGEADHRLPRRASRRAASSIGNAGWQEVGAGRDVLRLPFLQSCDARPRRRISSSSAARRRSPSRRSHARSATHASSSRCATLPFTRSTTSRCRRRRARSLIDDIERAFPDRAGRRHAPRADAVHLPAAEMDRPARRGDRIVATADRAALERCAPEALQARGPWQRFESSIEHRGHQRTQRTTEKTTLRVLCVLCVESACPIASYSRSAFAASDPAERLRLCREAVSLDPESRGRAARAGERVPRDARRRRRARRRSIAPRRSRRMGSGALRERQAVAASTTTCRARATRSSAPPT